MDTRYNFSEDHQTVPLQPPEKDVSAYTEQARTLGALLSMSVANLDVASQVEYRGIQASTLAQDSLLFCKPN